MERDERKYSAFQSNPSIKFLDQFDAVALILNRYMQCKSVAHAVRAAGLCDVILIPSFCLCIGDLQSDIRSLQDANVTFPVVCKPLVSHGKAEAHKMMLLFKEDDLSLVKCRSVVQSFENHDGILLKAYIIGDFFHLVTRPSIRNLPREHEPVFFNSQDVSKGNSRSFLNNAHGVPSVEDLNIDKALIKRVIGTLRARLRLELMGVDFVIPSNTDRKQRLAVIDVNIFPDYSCVPNFHFHLENLVREKLDLSKLPSPAAVTDASV
ncbi:inositol tetrakisphosphate 1 kinase [Echinococcus multilocularis]|uniref:inositol-1,3,4-trisphosphate 5/6-kinase n=1 Tax=Echinococcus multilocularis TaxID=6211 RepID=A0A087W1F4_ECHMU|nr:inositol tetrakisphosphate 1 kinase [Echinococcus multilocularis]